MVNYFFNNIIRFDIFNKLNYIHFYNVLNYIKFKFIFYSTNLYDILSSFIFTKMFSNSYIRLQLNLSKELSMNLVVNNIKNRVCSSLFLLLISKGLLFVNKLSIFSYSYHCNLKLLHLKSLQKACIFFNRLIIIPINISKVELNFINNNKQLN